MDITASAQWSDLAKAYETKKDLNLRELFAADADRARNFTSTGTSSSSWWKWPRPPT